MKNTPLLIWKKLANAHTDIFLFKSPFFSFPSAPEGEYHKFPSHTYRLHCFKYLLHQNISRHIPCSQPLSSCTGNLKKKFKKIIYIYIILEEIS